MGGGFITDTTMGYRWIKDKTKYSYWFRESWLNKKDFGTSPAWTWKIHKAYEPRGNPYWEEINEDFFAYLNLCPEGYHLGIPKWGDVFKYLSGGEDATAQMNYCTAEDSTEYYRWIKDTPKEGYWITADVVTINDEYVYWSPTGSHRKLSNAIGVVGYGGVQYLNQDDPEDWLPVPCPYYEEDPSDKPSIPIRVRFFVEN